MQITLRFDESIDWDQISDLDTLNTFDLAVEELRKLTFADRGVDFTVRVKADGAAETSWKERTSEQETTDRIRSLVERLAEQTGIAFTFGYIGNCGTEARRGRFDDRLWYVFAPHPGRVGTTKDSMGGYHTHELDQFIPLLHGALELVKVQAVAR